MSVNNSLANYKDIFSSPFTWVPDYPAWGLPVFLGGYQHCLPVYLSRYSVTRLPRGLPIQHLGVLFFDLRDVAR